MLYKYMNKFNKIKECPICGKKFHPWSYDKAKYCSVKCQQKEKYEQRISKVRETGNWQDG